MTREIFLDRGWEGGRKGERQTRTTYFGPKTVFSKKKVFVKFGQRFGPKNKKTVFSKKRSSSNLDHIFGPENSFQGGTGRPGGSKYFQGGTCPSPLLSTPMRQLHVKCLKQCHKCLQNSFGNTGAQQRYQWPKYFNLKVEKVFVFLLVSIQFTLHFFIRTSKF